MKNRLIDVDVLLEDIRNTITKKNDTFDWLNLISRQPVVNDAKKECNNDWIPCSERLPEEKGTYLVTVKKFGVTLARFAGQKENMHFDSNVIAWQPLPAPYQLKKLDERNGELCSERQND